MTDLDNNTDDDSADSARQSCAPTRAKSRAIDLLEKLLASNSATAEQLAAALMVPVQTIEQYRSTRPPMSLERQLLLATYTIEFVPEYARLGHLLRGQVRAAIAFAARETTTHRGPSPAARW